jgi:phenylacetate-CoA ligase
MPFVRYATGDLAVRSESPCGCAIPFSLLKELVGRTVEQLMTSDGRSVAATTHLCGLISQLDGVERYQFTENEIGTLDLEVVCNDLFTAQVEEQCRQQITEFFGLRSMTIRRVGGIEKTGMVKFRTFVSYLQT